MKYVYLFLGVIICWCASAFISFRSNDFDHIIVSVLFVRVKRQTQADYVAQCVHVCHCQLKLLFFSKSEYPWPPTTILFTIDLCNCRFCDERWRRCDCEYFHTWCYQMTQITQSNEWHVQCTIQHRLVIGTVSNETVSNVNDYDMSDVIN